jgi:hypothetical protein
MGISLFTGEKMNNTLRTILIASLVVVIALGLFWAGMLFASGRFGYGMMNAYGPFNMMGGYANPGFGNTPNGYGYGMMSGGGMMGGGGMTLAPCASAGVGGYGSGSIASKPISVEETKKAVAAYLARINDSDLEIEEIMVFDNGGYAIVKEKNSGVGAFELLIDPVTLAAYPEHGPNMMWNLKYGMMSGNSDYGGYGMMGGGMMGRWFSNSPSSGTVSAEMPISADQAAEYAQKYLDSTLPGVKVSDEITPFYGYYTIDLERDGKIIGMLSVNGYSGQVFPHTWHGAFIKMSE